MAERLSIQGGPVEFGPVVLRDTGAELTLEKDFTVTLGGGAVTARAGAKTDGASIPRFFWRLVGPPLAGKYRKAAIIHDAGYAGKLIWRVGMGAGLSVPYTRKDVDRLFLRLMKALKVTWWRRTMMYLAVRSFGKNHWTAR